jgi:hypothetical protein
MTRERDPRFQSCDRDVVSNAEHDGMPPHQTCWLLLLHVCIRALMNITGPSRKTTLSSAYHCTTLPVMLERLLAIARCICPAHRLA